MFKKLKKIFFIEDEQEEVVVNVEEPKEEIEEVTQETIVIEDLQEVQVEPTIQTFTIEQEKPKEKKRQPIPQHDFETILSPISGKSTKKPEAKFIRPAEKKEVVISNTIISPMFGKNKIEKKPIQVRKSENDEVLLEDFISNDNKEFETVQIKLFEGEN